ncbi:MAG: DUF1456 domain-containing protein [Candidatus Melainabacteria bacterium HGW-Melainabacteria-1]|jgi:uncharacterized protein YehS (DUF1456 family)|nr:MAG: DUF1456 domain-containing protein [Spirochaetae bacterium HGW-Spirochaetae-3]PKL74277.1 MAG: DUF1456 domain-containing protein [Candidatus Melainabacteria bacterium HGW-Melainabacteria-1]
MNTNDILRRLRFAVKVNDATMMEMMALAGSTVKREELDSYFKKEDEEGYSECPKVVLSALLDGMILKYRGPRPAAEGAKAPALDMLDNNMVLKKIRIALQLKEDDMIAIMKLAGIELSKNELTALFRKKGQKNYMECMDQFLRNFLTGLGQYVRAATPKEAL